jgi:hypothetical protein
MKNLIVLTYDRVTLRAFVGVGAGFSDEGNEHEELA